MVPETIQESKMTNGDKPKSLESTLQDMVFSHLAKISEDEIFKVVYPDVLKRIVDTCGPIPEVHVIQTPSGEERKLVGTTHEKFNQVLDLVLNDIPVYLAGPAGTGKNVICKQVAEALGLNFYFSNAVTQEYKLTGFVDANGNYQDTQFFHAFTEGGLFFLDEMDASIPEVLVILNAAIANRYFDFPKHGRIEANKDFRVIAAGNTIGTGANADYTGRYCLDRASLDRFALINVDYSPKIEMAIVQQDTELLKFCHAFRQVTKNAGIQCLFSYRSLDRIYKLVKQGSMPIQEVYDISLLKGLDKDDINVIKAEFGKMDPKIRDSKYVQYFLKM